MVNVQLPPRTQNHLLITALLSPERPLGGVVMPRDVWPMWKRPGVQAEQFVVGDRTAVHGLDGLTPSTSSCSTGR